MIDIEAAYVVDTDLLEVSAPPTPRRRLLAVLRATHAVVRMRGLCVRHRRLRLALADAVLFVRSRALPLFYQRCACDWPAQELRFGRFTLPLSTLRRVSDVDAARQEFVLHTAAGAPPRDTAYEMRVPSSADDFSRWLHALQQLVLLHAHDGADARSSPAPSCRRRDGTAEATPAHRRGGSVGGGSSSGSLAAVANWPGDFEMKTRSSDDALPLPATASGGRRAPSGGGGGLVGAWHRHCKSCACAVQSLGCSIADCCRACLPPPPRPAGPAPPRTSNGMRIVLVVLLLIFLCNRVPPSDYLRPRNGGDATGNTVPAAGARRHQHRERRAERRAVRERERMSSLNLSTGDDGAARGGPQLGTRGDLRGFRERGAANPHGVAITSRF